MGYKLVGSALDAKLPVSKNPHTGLVKTVLIALCDRACNETYTCFPSIGDLVRRSQASRATVKRCIYLLESYGLIAVQRRKVEGSKENSSNFYTINLEEVGSRRADHRVEESRPSGRGELSGRVEERQKPVNKPVNKPVIKPVGKKPPKNKSLKCITDDFEVTKKMKDWFEDKCFTFSIDEETERFINHHIAKGSKFVEPSRAWQNWMTGKFTPTTKKQSAKVENFNGYGETQF